MRLLCNPAWFITPSFSELIWDSIVSNKCTTCQCRICKPFTSSTLLYTYISRFSVDPHYWQRRIYIIVPFTNLRQFSKFFAFSVTRVLCEPCRKKYLAEQLLSRMWFLFSIVITVRKDCRHGGSDEHITADFGLFVFLLFIAATLFICRFSCLSHFKNDPYRFSYTLLLHISVQPFTGMLYFEREMWAAQKQVLIREGSVC